MAYLIMTSIIYNFRFTKLGWDGADAMEMRHVLSSLPQADVQRFVCFTVHNSILGRTSQLGRTQVQNPWPVHRLLMLYVCINYGIFQTRF